MLGPEGGWTISHIGWGGERNTLISQAPKGIGTRWCANKDAGPEGGRFGDGLTSIREKKSVSEDVGWWVPKEWTISHIS